MGGETGGAQVLKLSKRSTKKKIDEDDDDQGSIFDIT